MDNLQRQSSTTALRQTARYRGYCWRIDYYCPSHCQQSWARMESNIGHFICYWYCHSLCRLEGHVCGEFFLTCLSLGLIINTNRFYMACITAISARGSFSTTRMKLHLALTSRKAPSTALVPA